ncbi:MAG: hypothetical protein M1839_003437 [Geoglossum umbratile]|nr:MAG: hypothetical protein M1839_003437 [Geoglossum umbratile]
MSSPPTSDDGATQATADPLAGVPELVTYPTSSVPERILGLKLIADSIAQQRQLASRSLIYHPLSLSLYVLVLAVASHYIYRVPSDLAILSTTAIGITMAFLVAARWLTGEYIHAAEAVRWTWLHDDDLVVVTRFGDEIIGVVAVRFAAEGHRAEVRGWSVRLRFRGKGVGGALLEEAVRLARERVGREGEVVFADDHANSLRVLPNLFNRPFAKREARARSILQKIADTAAKEPEKAPEKAPPAPSKPAGRKGRKK